LHNSSLQHTRTLDRHPSQAFILGSVRQKEFARLQGDMSCAHCWMDVPRKRWWSQRILCQAISNKRDSIVPMQEGSLTTGTTNTVRNPSAFSCPVAFCTAGNQVRGANGSRGGCWTSADPQPQDRTQIPWHCRFPAHDWVNQRRRRPGLDPWSPL